MSDPTPTACDRELAWDAALACDKATHGDMDCLRWTHAIRDAVAPFIAQARAEERKALIAEFKSRYSPHTAVSPTVWSRIRRWIVAVIEARGREGA